MIIRTKDPRRPEDLSAMSLSFRKVVWRFLGLFGARYLVSKLYPKSTICFFDVKDSPGVKGTVAFTIDDAFCGEDNPGGTMLSEVLDLLREYEAKATFFVAGTHCDSASRERIPDLLADGHELANHSREDRPYNKESRQAFLADLNETAQTIREMGAEPAPWYRAPHAKFSRTMQQVLAEKGLTHVMVDCFANDTAIPDADFIAQFVLSTVSDGSIVLIHMPEKEMREWNLQAMRETLAGIRARGFDIVTVSDLVKRSCSAEVC
jgi:peptidoglycan/xylan/chitin deacetylase (PgdA/CDA1 family)